MRGLSGDSDSEGCSIELGGDPERAADGLLDAHIDQAEQRLFEKDRVHGHRRKGGRDLGRDAHGVLGGQVGCQGHGFGQMLLKIRFARQVSLLGPGHLFQEIGRRLGSRLASSRCRGGDMLLPEPIRQQLDGGLLLTAKLPRADAELVGDDLLGELLDVAAEQRLVGAPITRDPVLFALNGT